MLLTYWNMDLTGWFSIIFVSIIIITIIIMRILRFERILRGDRTFVISSVAVMLFLFECHFQICFHFSIWMYRTLCFVLFTIQLIVVRNNDIHGSNILRPRNSIQIQSNPFQNNRLLDNNYHLNASTYIPAVITVCYLSDHFGYNFAKLIFETRKIIGETMSIAIYKCH